MCQNNKCTQVVRYVTIKYILITYVEYLLFIILMKCVDRINVHNQSNLTWFIVMTLNQNKSSQINNCIWDWETT